MRVRALHTVLPSALYWRARSRQDACAPRWRCPAVTANVAADPTSAVVEHRFAVRTEHLPTWAPQWRGSAVVQEWHIREVESPPCVEANCVLPSSAGPGGVNRGECAAEATGAALAADRKRLEAYLTDDIMTLDQIESFVEEIAQDRARWWQGKLSELRRPEPSDTGA